MFGDAGSHQNFQLTYQIQLPLKRCESLFFSYQLPKVLSCLSSRRDKAQLLHQTQSVRVFPAFDDLAINHSVDETRYNTLSSISLRPTTRGNPFSVTHVPSGVVNCCAAFAIACQISVCRSTGYLASRALI